jgi:O-methyltransferase involved in polyketide biosynthesis
VYVEGDLPAMADRKRRALERSGELGAGHHVLALDALTDDGPQSLAAATRELLDPARGTAVVCEGLVSYLDPRSLGSLWTRVARWLGGFPVGLYLGDLYLANPDTKALIPSLFLHALSAFARTRVRMHFASAEEVAGYCQARGFERATVHWPAGQARAHVAVLDAETHRR